ncbi:MAG: permease, partial [Syntrophus sp. (in: bacteria)]|nr:permease [Syntrophus sp. (in: bacteria)]
SHLPVSGLILTSWASIPVFLAIGGLTGFISGMMGVGGGAVMVPLMVILANMGQHIAQGTSLLAMIPISISGSFTHNKLGNVRSNIVLGLAIGSVIGGFLGASFAKALPELYLRCIFAGVGFCMSIRYLRA